MYQTALSFSTVFILLLFIGCDNGVKDEHSPQVTPLIVNVDSNSVGLKWNNVGSQYYYNVLLGFDSIPDNDFRNVASAIESTTDTSCIVHGLQSKSWYKVKVRTIGGNLSPNESWPPLRFKTE
jgi:hypothetical protein